jgi:hypothetical protein
MTNMDPIERRITRCAIYTRKSTGHGLDAAVNRMPGAPVDLRKAVRLLQR